MSWRNLALLQDDLYLGMQGMNIGMADATITDWEYSLLREYFEIEKTPIESALHVSAFSQMWILTAYEIMRVWRERVYNYKKWHDNGGIAQAIENLSGDDPLNMTKNVRKRQLERYHDDSEYRERSDREWELFRPIFRLIELMRMNLAKHAAPGKASVMPRAPGYGRINGLCGAMDYEVVDKDNNYYTLNRRDLAERLRAAFIQINNTDREK